MYALNSNKLTSKPKQKLVTNGK